MPPPRKSPPRRRERRTRSRSYSPRPSYSSRRRSRSPKNVRERRRSPSPQRTRSPPRRRSRSPHERPRSPRPVAKWSPPRRSSPRRSRSPARRPKSPARRSRSHSFERDQPVKRVPADSSGKRVSAYRSRSPSPVHIKRPRDEREYREEPSRSDSRRDESRRFSSPVRGQESGYSPRGRSPSPKLRESPYGGKMYADKPSSSRAPLFPVGKGRNEISSVTIVNKARLEKLDKRFQTLEQISRGSFDFEENITIGIHRGPSHVTLDEDVPVNYEFNPKTFLMLYPKKETHKAIFDRDEILQFHHDDILDEEAYVEKRTITVQPNEKAKPKWTDSVDYKVTVGGRASRDDQYAGTDRRMVRDSGRRRSSRDPEVTVRLDPKPDPRYEKLFKETQRRGRSRSGSREPVPTDPHDLRHNLNKRRDDYDDDHVRNRERGRLGDRERDRLRDGREVVDARRKIEARRSEQGVSLDRGMDLHITRTEQKERRRSQERFRKEKIMLDIPCESDDSHVMSNIIFSEKYGKHSMRMSSASSDWRLKGLIGTTTDDLLWYSKHSFGYIISDVYSIAEPGFIAQSDACSTGIQEIAERGRASLDEELPDFKNRPESGRVLKRYHSPVRESPRFLDSVEPLSHEHELRTQEGEIQKVWIFGTGEMQHLHDLGKQTSLGTDLGLLERNIMVYWYTKRGLKFRDVLKAVHKKLDKGFTPDMIILHCGGNDLAENEMDLESEVRMTVDAISNELPNVKIVWSMILPRWLGQGNVGSENRRRNFLNEKIARFVLDSGGCYLRYPSITLRENHLYKKSFDGDIELSDEGYDRLLDTLKGGIVSILQRGITIHPELYDLEPLVSEFVNENSGKFRPLKKSGRGSYRGRGYRGSSRGYRGRRGGR